MVGRTTFPAVGTGPFQVVLAAVLAAVLGGPAAAQTTVTYTQQTGSDYFANSYFGTSGGWFNDGSARFGMYANGGGVKEAVA